MLPMLHFICLKITFSGSTGYNCQTLGLYSASTGGKNVSSDLVCAYWATIGVDREIGDARTHDDVLDNRARHRRVASRRRRYPHDSLLENRTISSRLPHFFNSGRDPDSLHLL